MYRKHKGKEDMDTRNKQFDETVNMVHALASPAMGHRGTCPPLDVQLVIILREQIRKMYKNNALFAQFLSIFGPFLFFLPTVFLRE